MGAKIVCLKPRIKHSIFSLSEGSFEIECKIIDVHSYKEKINILTSINNASSNHILAQIKEISLKSVKGALFCFTFCYSEKEIEIAKKLKEYFQKLKIPFFCCNNDSIYYSSILLSYVKEYGENIIENSQNLLIIFDDRKYGKEISARSIEIKKADNYFYFNDIQLINYSEYTEEKFKALIPSSTVLVYFESIFDEFYLAPNSHQENTYDLIAAKIKDKSKIRILKNCQKKYQNKAIVGKLLKLIGEKAFKYDFASLTYSKFILGAWESWMNTKEDRSFNEKRLLSINELEIIPAKKTIVFYQTFEKIVCANYNGKEYEGIEMPVVPEIGLAATFSIDSFFAPKVFVHKPEKVVENAAIIRLNHLEFSVEIIKNGNLESIGLDKVPLMISFADGSVQIGQEAAKIKEKQNSFVVTNLLTIAANLKHYDSNWGFKIDYDKNHRKYIIFDTFRGQRKTTVSFLFAVIIRWAIANAEIYLGKMPKTVVIVADRLRANLKDALEKGCKETKLINIDMQIHQYKIVEIK